ncbi:MAG: hypothetical protein CMN05_03815 [Roseibacillus sp.]|nr:hypothetical protein [Roseibacillus sp.]
MGKNPKAESSALGCILSGTWTLASLPFWLGAIGLLVVSTTTASKLFAIALICLLPVPLNFLHWRSIRRRIISVLLLLAGSISLFLCARQATGHRDDPDAAARVVYENGTSHFSCSPANLVPEIDQCLLGTYLLALIDPNLGWGQAAELRENIRNVYADLEKDAELATLPCVLGSAYREMIGLKPTPGILFIYVPEEPGQDPLEKKPAIVFLHGGLGNFQGCWTLWKRFADATGVAIVAPTFGSGNWSGEDGLEAIEQTREFCVSHPRIDGENLILAGIATGGTGVTLGGRATPEKWRGLLFLSPVIEKNIVESDAFANGWGGRKALIITGERDKHTTSDYVRKAAASMKDIKMELKEHYLPDRDHFLIYSDWPRLQELIGAWIKSL